jgi:predicted MFS family arabinose efflux permease
MVADAAITGQTGRDFGVTRFLDTLGALAGIALVLGLGVGKGPMREATFKACAWIALPVGLTTLALLLFWVPAVSRATRSAKRLAWLVPKEVRGYLAIVFVFSLANSSDAFLVLKARDAGFSVREILGLFLVFNAFAALLAVPAGRLSDRFGRVRFLALGWAVYAVAYAVMGTAMAPRSFAFALLGYGAFYGLTEGVEKALLADLLQPEHRGSGFGALESVIGLAALLASPLMGVVMTTLGARAAFLMTGGLAGLAMAFLVIWAVLRQPRLC